MFIRAFIPGNDRAGTCDREKSAGHRISPYGLDQVTTFAGVAGSV